MAKEIVDLCTEGFVGNPCSGCGTHTQFIEGKIAIYKIFTAQDPETGKWWCNRCYAADGADERRAALVQGYQERQKSI